MCFKKIRILNCSLKFYFQHARVIAEHQAGVRVAVAHHGVHRREKMLRPRTTEDLQCCEGQGKPWRAAARCAPAEPTGETTSTNQDHKEPRRGHCPAAEGLPMNPPSPQIDAMLKWSTQRKKPSCLLPRNSEMEQGQTSLLLLMASSILQPCAFWPN